MIKSDSDDGEVARLRAEVAALTLALETADRRNRVISENIADIIYICDSDARITYVSPSITRVLGFAPEERIGVTIDRLGQPYEPAAVKKEVTEQSTRSAAGESTLELPLRTKDGRMVWCEGKTRTIRDESGAAIESFVILRDITDRKAATDALVESERRLVARGERLSALNERLESFAATVSHDLQAPLRRIERMLRRADSAPEPGSALLTDVRQEVTEMSEFVDHILDISRSHAQPLRRSEIDIAALFAHVVERAKTETGRACTAVLPNRPAQVHADQQLVRSVLDNIVGNAFKYVPLDRALQLQLQVEVRDGIETVSITDNGDGFEDSISELTNSFHRGPYVGSQPGHGIGLATVRSMIERHDGRLSFENDDVAGGRVVFTLGEIPGPSSSDPVEEKP